MNFANFPISAGSRAVNRQIRHNFACPRQGYFLVAVCIAILLTGCASSGAVKDLDQDNQIQDQRLAAIEETSGREITRMAKEVKEMQQQLRSTRGRLINMSKKVKKLLTEQAAVTEGQEKLAAQNRIALRKLEKSEKASSEFRSRQGQELDALRLSLTDMQKLMKTSISSLPSKTKADQKFRDAFVSMVSGELDIAAGRFRAFVKEFPKEERVPDAKYRGGQAYFLMRKYDHAIVPFFELVDKYGGHKLAVDARWMLARCLEETGDLKLAREFYAKLITENTIHKDDATRRVYFINELYPVSKKPPKSKKGKAKTTAKKPAKAAKKTGKAKAGAKKTGKAKSGAKSG